jgi:guanosine-3',5'-bis(diphosphate) 3'-pyrophosphohydrolase
MSDIALLLRATDFAAYRHRRQVRKGSEGVPYVSHPVAVAELIARVGRVTDIVTLVAAILHDTIEDTETTAEEIAEQFGAEVRDVVLELTDDKSLPKEERKRLQIVHAPKSSKRAKIVKLSDKIVNVRDVTRDPPPDWSVDRRREYLDWSEQVIAGCRGVNAALERCFDQVVKEGRKLIGTG